MTFQVAVEAARRALNQASWSAPIRAASGPIRA